MNDKFLLSIAWMSVFCNFNLRLNLALANSICEEFDKVISTDIFCSYKWKAFVE